MALVSPSKSFHSWQEPGAKAGTYVSQSILISVLLYRKGSYSHLDDEDRSIAISVSAKGNGSASPVVAAETPGSLRK